MKNITFRRNTFYLALISAIASFIYTLRPIADSWNLNQTIGWVNESSPDYWLNTISYWTLPIFAFVYALLFLAKREIKSLLFWLHLFIILMDLIAYFHIIPIPRMLFLSWFTFILGVFLSRNAKINEIQIRKY